MNRREFLVTSGTGVLCGSSLSAVTQEPAVAVDFQLSGTEIDGKVSDIEKINVGFNQLDMRCKYVDESEEMKLSVELDMGEYGNTEKAVYVSPENGSVMNADDKMKPMTMNLSGINADFISGSLIIRVEHPDVSDKYVQQFTITSGELNHINNYETVKQSSADEGSITADEVWQKLMSKNINTDGGPVYIDFHTSVTGGTHNTFAVRILIDGKETTLARQTDSDGTNQKMVSLFDIADLSSGDHKIEIEWKGYNGGTYIGYNQPNDATWSIYNEASLNLMELNKGGTSHKIEETTSSVMSGSNWTDILSTDYTVESGGILLFKAFLSSNIDEKMSNGWNKTRLLIDGNTVNYSRSGESNDGYVINALAHVDQYTQDEQISVKLQWKEDLGTYRLDGATARLGVFEFAGAKDFVSKNSSSGSATGSWGEVSSGSMTHRNNLAYAGSQISADVTNNNDFFTRLLVNGSEKTRQTTGVSDDGAYDTSYITSLVNNTNDNLSVESQWQAEGSTGLVDSKLFMIGLRSRQN